MLALGFLFTLYGLSICWASYLPVWQQRELGFSAATVGAVQAGICVTSIFAVPVFCATLDALGGGLRAEIFTASVFLVKGGLHASFLLMPNFAADGAVNTWAFPATIFGLVMAEVLRGASGAILDVACLQKLGGQHRSAYGRIRLWISLTWGCGASVIGAIRPSPLSLIFLLSPFFSVCVLLFYWATLRTPAASSKPPHSPLPKEGESATGEGVAATGKGEAATGEGAAGRVQTPNDAPALSYFTQVRVFIRQSDRRIVELIVVFFLLGTARRSFETFVFLLMDDLGGGTQLMGLATLVQVLSELPAYFFFPQISAFLGSRGVLYLSASCYVVRAAWYANVSSAWGVLIVEPLHGITFALLFSAVITISADVAPPGLQGTAQGVLARGVFDGAGGVLGSAAGGILFNQSPALLFKCVAGLSLIACGVVAIPDLLAWRSTAVKAGTARGAWWVGDGLSLGMFSTWLVRPREEPASSRAATANSNKGML
jgi:hypothetical protein